MPGNLVHCQIRTGVRALFNLVVLLSISPILLTTSDTGPEFATHARHYYYQDQYPASYSYPYRHRYPFSVAEHAHKALRRDAAVDMSMSTYHAPPASEYGTPTEYGAPSYGPPVYGAPVHHAHGGYGNKYGGKGGGGGKGFGKIIGEKGAIKASIISAIKAIKGGIIAIKGKIIKTKGNLLAAKGGIIEGFGKGLVEKAQIIKAKKNKEQQHGYGGSGGYGGGGGGYGHHQ